jgi:division/cell wall cluster transcriptional repressor MraZ
MLTVGQSCRHFTGEHAYRVDSQRRLALPTGWRGESEGDRAFMLLAHEQPCIEMMPMAMFEKKLPALEEEFQRNPDALVSLGSLAASATAVVVDRQGRFALTPGLMAHAAITDRVVLVGTFLTIALWAPEEWEQRREPAAKARQVYRLAASRPDELGQVSRPVIKADQEA